MLTKIRERTQDALLREELLCGEANFRPFIDIAMGICGAVVGGMRMRSAGIGGYGGTIITTLVAMLGAVLLTLVAGLVNGRKMYARQL